MMRASPRFGLYLEGIRTRPLRGGRRTCPRRRQADRAHQGRPHCGGQRHRAHPHRGPGRRRRRLRCLLRAGGNRALRVTRDPVRDAEDLSLSAVPLRGRRVLAMGASGGDMAMTADAARNLALDFAPLPRRARCKLREILTEQACTSPTLRLPHAYLVRPAQASARCSMSCCVPATTRWASCSTARRERRGRSPPTSTSSRSSPRRCRAPPPARVLDLLAS